MKTTINWRRSSTALTLLVMVIMLLPATTFASMQRSRGQTIYLSVIPQVEGERRMKTIYLRFWMIVRNTDLNHAVTIRSITYHNGGGQLEKKILDQPLTLNPLASHAMRFKEKDLAISRGMSACMIVHWEAPEAVSPVLVDGAVIGSGTGWTTGMVVKGVVVEENN